MPNAPPWPRASRWAGWSARTRSPRPSPTWPARWPGPPRARRWLWTAACRACGSGQEPNEGITALSRGMIPPRSPAHGGLPPVPPKGPPMTTITGFDTFDIRFPTSRTLAGSDAMNPAPDYSAAYVLIRTDAADTALSGHGFAFTIGSGNDVQLAAIRLLEPFLAGQDLDEVLADLGGLGRRLVSDSPLHWLGPSCGVMHMATGAVLNACWDLAARRAAKPLWLLLAEMSPEEIIALVDFRYLSEALTPDEALALLERGAAG